MTTTTLLVDGMLSGTGVRDAINGGYIQPASLGLSTELTSALGEWVSNYQQAHFQGYSDAETVSALDQEGLSLAKRLASERADHSVGYFSTALMRRLDALPHI